MNKPTFHVGDLVHVVSPDGNLEGPYTVASVLASDACTLCDEDGKPARDGCEIKMDRLSIIMCDTSIRISRYAILIGINAYPEKPLEGSVEDVQRINQYLEETLTSVQIEMLTDARSDDSGVLDLMETKHIIWPTPQNVISALKRVITSAKTGDLVYIHYSGHGTRLPAGLPHSNESTGDLALVLLDKHGKECEFLQGISLAFRLKQMVNKGLVVTLVLDCCFSAAVYRREVSKVRCLPYNPNLHSMASTFTETCLVDTRHSGNRDACMLSNWLIDPDGYAILAACGPHEEAKEFDPGNGRMHGALSYHLLSFIKTSGLQVRHSVIHKHLESKFRGSDQKGQNPVLYGNKNQTFFQQANSEDAYAITSVIKNRDSSLILSAGNAHGVSIGDCFALQPTDSTSDYSVSVRVVRVEPLTSEIELLEGALTPTQTEWFATGYPQKYFQKHQIRLASNLSNPQRLLAALEARSLSCHVSEAQPYSLYITMNDKRQYEIYDKLGKDDRKIENLPDMEQGGTDFDFISKIIEHLVRYSLTRDLNNSVIVEGFQLLFNARITGPSGEPHAPGSVIETDEGIQYRVVVENTGKTGLYIHVYNLGPNWQIANVLGGYDVIPPQDPDNGYKEWKRKISTKVPTELIEKGVQQCEDVIKIFITSQPTSFDLLELPKLVGKHETRNPIKSAKARSGKYSYSETSENWAVLNFTIQTFAKN
ncbi:hypothetical protein FQN57_007394 [Myotisia sp. PD_48]|nr:hypothetical protein FQN57_007394 [Myotisia sp. PD_48]